jgi:signal transduction histidine kinase
MGRGYADLAAAMPRDLAVALGALDADDEDGGGDLDLPRASVQWRSFAVSAGDRVVGRVVSLSDVSEERQLARLRDDVTHMMVHDLRGPLTSIHGILALLQESPEIGLPQRASAAVDAAVRATEKLRGLVTGILDVSRLESGALPVNRQPVDALALVHEVLALEAASAALAASAA